jgi:hypothetical protein
MCLALCWLLFGLFSCELTRQVSANRSMLGVRQGMEVPLSESGTCFFICVCVLLGIEPRTPLILGKQSATEL